MLFVAARMLFSNMAAETIHLFKKSDKHANTRFLRARFAITYADSMWGTSNLERNAFTIIIVRLKSEQLLLQI